MGIKIPPKKDQGLENKLISLGYSGFGTPADHILGSPQHDAALNQYDSHEIDGKIVRAKQFDGFFRYLKGKQI